MLHRLANRRGVAGRLTATDGEVLRVWLFSRLAVAVTVAVAGYLLARGERVVPYLDRWRQWDVLHYQEIATNGYAGGDGTPLEAFFPGLPLLLRLLSAGGLHPTAAGLLISAVAGAVAALALARLGALDASPLVGRRAVLLLVASPPAVFLAAGYTESLFLGLALPAWLAARQGRWAAAAVLAAAASSVRVTGLFLAAALVVQWLTAPAGPRRLRHAGVLALPVLPPLAYMAWLRATTGDWLAWVHAQQEGWYRSFTDPVTALLRTWEAAFGGGRPAAEMVMFQAELVAVAVGAVLAVLLLWRRRWGEATYVGLQLAALVTSTWFFSVPRASLLWWPLWLLLAGVTVARPILLAAYLALAVPLSVLWAAAFTSGLWAG